jgi:5-hydroxyisourate hydrolase-like protein (transthyretin family)
MTHLTYETLLNYLEERLPPEERNAVDAHLASVCESCGRHLALLRKVFETVNHDHSTPPPAAVLKRAVDIPLTNPRAPQPATWQRLVAALSFDSHLQLSSALTRGSSRERQMLFSAEQMEIDVKISPARGSHDLLGQIMGEPSENVSAAFVSLQSSTGQFLKATETDSLGQFAFHEISSGVYDLIFDLETQEIAVHGLEVGNE